ncbi:MAG: hypothetical protein IJ397_03905 [Lachnospiraceae bacterium]|nr:hypothetical protein [Lachnospiraceae bacterium]
MDDNTRLINIYIKIHNKKNITMDDLRYLAKYDPECFRKTCKNVVYNIPETKAVMEGNAAVQTTDEKKPTGVGAEVAEESKEFDILAVLDNLKQMDAGETFYKDVDPKRVKNLLGNLFMELLFPHNDEETFIYEDVSQDDPTFDVKA